MENLSESNMFTSHFVMGCYWNSKTNLDCINSLTEWLNFKDTDYGMNRYRSNRTQYVSFLGEIDLKELKLIIEDLISIYKKSYPYGTKEDFIDHVFSYTLFDLERFISREYIGMGYPSKSNYQYYNYYDLGFNEFLDFAIPEIKTIEYFKQYYKQVISLINNIPFTKNIESNSKLLDEGSLRSRILKVNMKNSEKLSEEYGFSEDDRLFIYRTFWPIIVLENLDSVAIQKTLASRKHSFIQKNGTFDVEIFKRSELDYLLYELNEFFNCIKKGKSRIWDNRNGDYFHWLKLEMDTANAQTLVISKCDEIQLEIYIKGIVSIINDFLEDEKIKTSKSISDKQTINEYANLKTIPLQPIIKQKPEFTAKLISFKSPQTIEKLHNELKGYFHNKETELLKALQGNILTDLLLFPHNQNKFVEVFKRAKYNGFILSSPKQINNWICSNFTYYFEKGNTKEVRNFSPDTIKTILTNHNKERQAEPTPSERICIPDWLPHFWHDKRKEH